MRAEARPGAALQAAMVRLMVDPAFRERVYAGGEVPGVPADQLAQLLAVDPRAWSVDVHRRGRLLTSVLEEYPVTAAILGVAQADAFFSSPAFVAVLEERGSMALGFGAWAARRAGEVATLERAVAEARRDRELRGAARAPGWRRALGTAAFAVGQGVVEAWLEARAQLGPRPLERLAQIGTGAAPPVAFAAPRSAKARAAWIATCDERGEAGLDGLDEHAPALLSRADVPRAWADLARDARKLYGGRRGERALDTLRDEGWLVETAAAPP